MNANKKNQELKKRKRKAEETGMTHLHLAKESQLFKFLMTQNFQVRAN
jgi:hypothetical protein